jgi:HK97 family phage major capsid protein
VNFGAWKGSTGLIRVSLEIMQDSAFSLEAFLTEAFAIRMGRGYEAYLTNGSGSSQPKGILPAIANSGATPVVAAGSAVNDGVNTNTGANSIGYNDLVNLIHSVDPTYRMGAKFMLHDQSVRYLKTLLDKFGRPLWVPGVKDGEPDTLCGYPYVINQSMPTIAPSATTVAFGSWRKFIVRKVKDLQVMRLDERFADFGEVAYVAFSRIDSNLVDAGTHPLNVLTQHS